MFKIKKIASILSSALMIGSTIGLAAAANYPAPFVSGGSPNVGIVYGSSAAVTDFAAVSNIVDNLNNNLNSFIASGTTGSSEPSVSGEAYELFTSSSPLELNASVNSVRTTVTETNLPSVLSDGEFSGDEDATTTFKIIMGSHPKIQYVKEPTSSDDPTTGVKVGTSASNYLYNATVTFSRAVNFTDPDSTGEELTLFGQKFTVAAATTNSKLVLLKNAQDVTLTNNDPSREVTVGGETYTVELISSSDSDATIKVTDSDGNSDSKTINEAASSTVQGLEIAVDSADENNFALTAVIFVGSSRITFQDGNEVTVGTSEDPIEGTQVDFYSTTSQSPENLTSLTIQVFSPDGNEDFITPGNAFVDPVFDTFKLDFIGLNIAEDSATRENIGIDTSGNDKMTISFTNWQGKELSGFEWLNNETGGQLTSFLGDSSDWPIIVSENAKINESAYVVVGNEDEGYLLKLRTITNSTGTSGDRYGSDSVVFENVFDTSQTWTATLTDDGAGTLSLGSDYGVVYWDDKTDPTGDEYVRLNYPDSANQQMIVYPTIETVKGAKLAFYEPLTIDLGAWDGSNEITSMAFPDGDGYTTATITAVGNETGDSKTEWNITGAGTGQLNTGGGAATALTVGSLTYWLTTTGTENETKIFLQDVNGGNVSNPAIVLFEEKDESNVYNAVVIQTGGGGDSNNGVGVSDVDFTWNSDADMSGSAYGDTGLQHEDNDDIYSMMDLWGTLVTSDQSTSDQYTSIISYPDDQVVAQIYVAEVAATIEGGSSPGGGTTVGVPLLDTQVSLAGNANLIVVGGSCVNTYAATLLGSSTPLCGADFTAETGVESGQFLIKTFARSGGAVATLVAGYNAGDTTNAGTFLTTRTVSTNVGDWYNGTSATSATMQTETA